jgi:hypothetical protein
MNLKGIKFEVQNGLIKSEEKSFEGKSYTSHTQEGWMHTPEKPFPIEFRISHEKPTSTPIAPGFYELSTDAITVRNGRLQLKPTALIPLANEQQNVRPAPARQTA